MGIFDFFKKGVEKPVEKQRTEQNGRQTQAINKEYYTVVSGDSLSKIAQKYYGDPMKWRDIYEANRDQIKNPDLIHPGQKFLIPNINPTHK